MFWKIVGLIAGACAAPLTGGTSLLAMATLCGGIGLVAGHFLDLDSEKRKQENQKLAMAGQAGEVVSNQVKGIQDQRTQVIQEAEELVKELQKHKAKLNDPNATPEEKDKAKKMIPIIESQLDDHNKKISDFDKKIDDLMKNLPGISVGKQEFDIKKIMIIGGAGLVIYLLLKNDRER